VVWLEPFLGIGRLNSRLREEGDGVVENTIDAWKKFDKRMTKTQM